MSNQKNTALEEMEFLSIESRNLIKGLLLEGFSPQQIVNAMDDGEYLANAGVSLKCAEEIMFFMLDNWEAIQKIGV